MLPSEGVKPKVLLLGEITGRFDQELVDVLPSSLKFVSHNGAGYDSIDAAACAARGISVSNTPGAVDACSADTAIFLILGALRRIHIPYTAIRAGKWRGRMGLTHEPEGKTLGILGMGGIGTAVARRAQPFGLHVQYHNRSCVPEQQNMVGAKYVSFEELLETSDIISVHLPLNASTYGLISYPEFAKMKDGVVLVNTARGPIVNEDALVEALESGKMWGAGLDVHEHEPEVHSGLIENENCVLLPHVGTATVETQRKMEVLVVENVRSALERGCLLTPVQETRKMVNGYASNGCT
ncbi:glyoxylate reductase, partial [Lecanoromycetidae sp. Uapishka_2]